MPGFTFCMPSCAEGSSYVAVDHATGRQCPMLGFPAVSPDRKRAVAFSAAGEANYDGNGVEVWRINQGKPRVEYTYTPDARDWSPTDTRWSGPSTIKARGPVRAGYAGVQIVSPSALC